MRVLYGSLTIKRGFNGGSRGGVFMGFVGFGFGIHGLRAWIPVFTRPTALNTISLPRGC